MGPLNGLIPLIYQISKAYLLNLNPSFTKVAFNPGTLTA